MRVCVARAARVNPTRGGEVEKRRLGMRRRVGDDRTVRIERKRGVDAIVDSDEME